MGKIVLKEAIETVTVKGEKKRVKLLNHKKFDRFNPHVLGLGNISLPSKEVEAIAAAFDLSGFSIFCSRVDPHLSVPDYLSRFLDWLFNEIRKEFVEESYKEGKRLWADLPFLAKFMGDGVLFLWDARNMSEVAVCNVVATLNIIRRHYREQFYPRIRTVVADPPATLKCGIARGKVFSVGNRQDYVGPCINIASKLQKFSLLTFCVCRRGFDINKAHKSVRQQFVEKCVTIRGIGENELVWVLKEEFDDLPEEEKASFREP